jgi:hypothetical protein
VRETKRPVLVAALKAERASLPTLLARVADVTAYIAAIGGPLRLIASLVSCGC